MARDYLAFIPLTADSKMISPQSAQVLRDLESLKMVSGTLYNGTTKATLPFSWPTTQLFSLQTDINTPFSFTITPKTGKQVATLRVFEGGKAGGTVIDDSNSTLLTLPHVATHSNPVTITHSNPHTAIGGQWSFAMIIEDEKAVVPPTTKTVTFENYVDEATNHYIVTAQAKDGSTIHMVGNKLTVPYEPANGIQNMELHANFIFSQGWKTKLAQFKREGQTFYNDVWRTTGQEGTVAGVVYSSIDTSYKIEMEPSSTPPPIVGESYQRIHVKTNDPNGLKTVVITEASDGKSGIHIGQFNGQEWLKDVATGQEVRAESRIFKVTAKPEAGYEIEKIVWYIDPAKESLGRPLDNTAPYPIGENDQTDGEIVRSYDGTGSRFVVGEEQEVHISFTVKLKAVVPADTTVDVSFIKSTVDSKYSVSVKADGVITKNTANVFHVPDKATTVVIEFEADTGFTISNINKSDTGDEPHGVPVNGLGLPKDIVQITTTPAEIADKSFIVTAVKKAISGGSVTTSTGVTGYNGYRLIKDERGITTLLSDIYQDGSGINWARIIQSVINYPIKFPDAVYGSEVSIVGNNGLTNSKGLNVLVSSFEVVMSKWNIQEKYSNVYNYNGATAFIKLPFITPYEIDLELITNRELEVGLVVYMGSTTAVYNIYVDGSLVDSIEFQLGKEYELFETNNDEVRNDGDTGALLNGIKTPFVEIQRNIPIVEPLGYRCNREGALMNEQGYIEAKKLQPALPIPDNHLAEINNLLSLGVTITK